MCWTMYLLTECLRFIWYPRKREPLVPGLRCTVSQLYSPPLKFRFREGGKQAPWGMHRKNIPQRSFSTNSSQQGLSQGDRQESRDPGKANPYNCSSAGLACSGCGSQPFGNVGYGHVQSRCLGMLQTFQAHLLSYVPFGRNHYSPLLGSYQGL